MSYSKATALMTGVLLMMGPVLAQKRDAPSSHFVRYRGADLEIRFPDNWVVTKTGSTVTLSPEDGNVEGALAYGVLMDIFEPRSRGSSIGGSPGEVPAQTTLAEATDQLIEELQRTNPNLRPVRRVQQEVGGLAAVEVEMISKSPVGGVEVNRLIAVRRSNMKLQYFLAVAPQAELNVYGPIFNKMNTTIRFYN